MIYETAPGGENFQKDKDAESGGDTDCISLHRSQGMKKYNAMKDNSVLLICGELEKQLLSDRHGGIISSIVAYEDSILL
jgi:hypothetical protein